MIGSTAFIPPTTDLPFLLKNSLFPVNLPNSHFIKFCSPRTRRVHVHLSASLTDNRSVKSKTNTNDPISVQSQTQHKGSDLSQRWREIQGSNDWKGLVDPLDPLLRSEILRYGEFAQVCYDSFDYDENSKYRGSCKFKKSKLLEEANLPNTGYEVTRYLYATSVSDVDLSGFFIKPKDDVEDAWSKSSNWMGYVAVCNSEEQIQKLGRRDIVVAWRGTITALEWLEDLKDFLVPSGLDSSAVKVEKGFLHLYTSKNSKSRYAKLSAREQLLNELNRLVSIYEDEEISITVTGHSLGGALALLSGYDIAQSGLTSNRRLTRSELTPQAAELHPMFEAQEKKSDNVEIPLTVITFGGPRVGNDRFRERCEELKVKTLRIVNEKDIVPKSPGFLLNENLGPLIDFLDNLPWTFSHVGVEIKMSSNLSPYLQPSSNPGDHHNLEGHLHLIDGFHGHGREFRSATDRDPALVNKSCGFLRPNLKIPVSWWQAEHKGLVRNEKGRWVQPERDEDEFH